MSLYLVIISLCICMIIIESVKKKLISVELDVAKELN